MDKHELLITTFLLKSTKLITIDENCPSEIWSVTIEYSSVKLFLLLSEL